MTLTEFRTRYPEFVNADDFLVSAALADAALQVSSDVWGTLTDYATGLLCAHQLSISPFGRGVARLEGKADGSTTYLAEFKRLTPGASGGLYRVP